MMFPIVVFLLLSAMKGRPAEAAIGWRHAERCGMEPRRHQWGSQSHSSRIDFMLLNSLLTTMFFWFWHWFLLLHLDCIV
jgi:hypothetical protein